jgi:Tfp pilus assembly protein PilW
MTTPNFFQTRRNSRGFSIMECVIALPIMGIVLFMAARLFLGCTGMFRYSAMMSTGVSQRDAVIFRLRRDVRRSGHMKLLSRRLLQCTMPNGQMIDWHISRAGLLVRIRIKRGRPAAGAGPEAVMKSAHFVWSRQHRLCLRYAVQGRTSKIELIPPIDALWSAQR